MKQNLIIAIGIWLIATPITALGPIEKTVDSGQIKYGTLQNSESWSGDLYILGDVTIPVGMSLTVLPGTQLHMADFDLLKSGDNPSQPEWIVHGTLDIQSPESNPVIRHELGNQYTHHLPPKNTQVIAFEPYTVDTSEMTEEFRNFKKQYISFWSIVYLIAYAQLAWN